MEGFEVGRVRGWKGWKSWKGYRLEGLEELEVRRFTVRHVVVGRLLSQSVVVVSAHFVSNPPSVSLSLASSPTICGGASTISTGSVNCRHTSCVSNCPTFHLHSKKLD